MMCATSDVSMFTNQLSITALAQTCTCGVVFVVPDEVGNGAKQVFLS